MIGFVRTRFKLVCLICFAMTSGAGVAALLKPGLILMLTGAPFDQWVTVRFFFQFGFLLVAIVGVWFLIIMADPDKNRPLLALATAEKLIFVAFLGWALSRGIVGLMILPIALGDLLMGAACLIYLTLGSGRSAEQTRVSTEAATPGRLST